MLNVFHSSFLLGEEGQDGGESVRQSPKPLLRSLRLAARMTSLLSLRRQAARLVMVRLGSFLDPVRTAHDDCARVRALCDTYPLGGVLLFNARWPAVANVLSTLQDAASAPLLVGADIERGVGQQVDGATLLPHALSCGRAGPQAVRLLARITALEAAACGIHWAFAPVADLRNEPRNPIIATRAFGDTAPEVIPAVTSYVDTAETHGLATTAKHAPGHGRTTTDSHAERPCISASAATLAEHDARPFQAAIQAGVPALMTAHVSYPALDPQERPATASPPILHELMRTQWGFDGLIVSDSLLMDGINAPGPQAAALVAAGVDMLLDPADPEAVIEGIAQAVHEGALSEIRLQQAVARVDRLAEWVKTNRRTGLYPDPQAAMHVGRPLHHRASRAIARAGLEQSPGSSNRTVPGPNDLMVRLSARPSHRDNDQALREALEAACPGTPYLTCTADASPEHCADIARRVADAQAVWTFMAVEPAAWQDFRLPDSHAPVLQALRSHPHVTAIALGSPHVLQEVPTAATTLSVHSDVPAAQEAAVEWIATTDTVTNP